MTRRIESLDRVKELSSVPVAFFFDVLTMLYSEGAPALKKELHSHSVNLTN